MADSTQHSAGQQVMANSDPLGSLHKMSTTAGVGSGEYVEINGWAVWTMVLGLASSLAILDAVLLVIPLTAIVFAFVALRQIANSNGTQAGRGLAWGGLVLALGFAGFRGTLQWKQFSETRADRAAMAGMLEDFGQNVKDGKFDQAYQLFSQQFQQRVSKEQFSGQLRFLQKTQIYGNLVSIKSNGYFEFEDSPADPDLRLARTTALIAFDKTGEPLHEDAYFRHQGGKWYIDNIPRVFPADETKKKKE